MDALRMTGADAGPEHAGAFAYDDFAPAPVGTIASQPQSKLETELDAEAGVLWVSAAACDRPSCDARFIADLAELRDSSRRAFAGLASTAPQPFRHIVMRSSTPGRFNLGRRNDQLAARIRAADRTALQADVDGFVRSQLATVDGYDLPVVTIALIEGAALGAGFEFAMAHDVLIAERSARFGFPEIQAGLFPAGGAASFLIRRLGRAKAVSLLLSGQLFSGEELHAIGLVDVLADDGRGEDAARQFLATHARRFAMQRAVYAGRRRVTPLSLEELEGPARLWAETAMTLGDAELAILDRLADAEQANQ